MVAKRTGINLDDLNIIDESSVPAKPRRNTPYRELLKKIPIGKALVLTDDQVSIDSTRSGIRRLQKNGEFKKYIIRQQKNVKGIRILYIINPSPKRKR